MQHEIILSLGTNIGKGEENIQKAYEMLDMKLGERVKTSSCFTTKPWGFESNNMFTNSVAIYKTEFSPEYCLQIIHHVEKEMGRKRNLHAGYEDRIIDIDILFYDDSIINNSNLIIPHPLIIKRDFVLMPLCEIAPNKLHPVLKKTIKELVK